MQLRFPAVRLSGFGILLTAVVAVIPAVASAQAPPQIAPPETAQPKKLPQPPPKLPRIAKDQIRGLDFLFGALKAAPDEESAKHVEARIWALWTQTSSDTTALLMQRSKVAMDAKRSISRSSCWMQCEAASRLHRRLEPPRDAALHAERLSDSLEDIEQVLIREPRHFGAFADLGKIMQELGDDKRALDAFRKALAINPHLENVPDLVKTLTEKIEGRDI